MLELCIYMTHPFTTWLFLSATLMYHQDHMCRLLIFCRKNVHKHIRTCFWFPFWLNNTRDTRPVFSAACGPSWENTGSTNAAVKLFNSGLFLVPLQLAGRSSGSKGSEFPIDQLWVKLWWFPHSHSNQTRGNYSKQEAFSQPGINAWVWPQILSWSFF